MTTTPMTRSMRYGPVDVHYDDRVLEPRPWTLLHSEWAAELARSAPPGRLLELCAGAGHTGLAAAVLADRDLLQVEIDPVAAAFAERNAARAGWARRVEVRALPMDAALTPEELFPIVLADPPYLPTADISAWPDDPVGAIDGGPDGLALARLCLAVAADHLPPGGHLLLQVAGPGQADQVRELVADSALTAGDVRVHDEARAVLLLSRR